MISTNDAMKGIETQFNPFWRVDYMMLDSVHFLDLAINVSSDANLVFGLFRDTKGSLDRFVTTVF